MGMFDYVDFEMKCPGCGEKVSGFQSKDGDCLLSTLKPSDVSRYYTDCGNCHGWIEFNRVEPKTINDFEMQFFPEDKIKDRFLGISK